MIEGSAHAPPTVCTSWVATLAPTNRSILTVAPVRGPSGPVTVPERFAAPGAMSVIWVVAVARHPGGAVTGGSVDAGATVVVTSVVGGVVVVGVLSPDPPHDTATTATTTASRTLRTMSVRIREGGPGSRPWRCRRPR